MRDTIYTQLRDRDWLYEEYVKKVRSTGDIAKEVGCHWSAAARALRRLGIPSRKRTSKYPLLNDKDWLREMYEVRGLSTREIGTLVGGAAGGVVYSALAPAGILPRSSEKGLSERYPGGRWGKNASNWHGGRRIMNGYVYVYIEERGPVQEHRLVMEQQLGRLLNPDEIVHHKDGNKQNNSIENLEVMRRGSHTHNHFESVAALHKRIRELEAKLNLYEARYGKLNN